MTFNAAHLTYGCTLSIKHNYIHIPIMLQCNTAMTE